MHLENLEPGSEKSFLFAFCSLKVRKEQKPVHFRIFVKVVCWVSKMWQWVKRLWQGRSKTPGEENLCNLVSFKITFHQLSTAILVSSGSLVRFLTHPGLLEILWTWVSTPIPVTCPQATFMVIYTIFGLTPGSLQKVELCYWWEYGDGTIVYFHFLHINPHTTHNSSNCSDEGLTLKMSAFLAFTQANLCFQLSC